MRPFLTTTRGTQDPPQSGPNLPWLHDAVAASLHTCPYPPHPTLQLLPFLSPLLCARQSPSPWHWTCLPGDHLPLHPAGLPSHAGSRICSQHFHFLASSPAAFLLPCPARHEMPNFAITWPSAGSFPAALYTSCFPSGRLCLPHGQSSLSSSDRSLEGFLFQEDGPYHKVSSSFSPLNSLTLSNFCLG